MQTHHAAGNAALKMPEVENAAFKVNLAVNDQARVVIFHNQPFHQPVSRLEFDLNRNWLDFILLDGSVLNFGIAVPPDLSKYMQNAYQVLLLLVDEDSGEAERGIYVPIIMHRT